MSAPDTIHSPRGRRGTAATVTALLAVLVCAVAATEAVSIAVHRRTVGFSASSVVHYGDTTRLSSPAVLTAGIIAAAVGLLALCSALITPRRRLLELANEDPHLAEGVTGHGVRRALTAAAEHVDGVSAAVTTKRRTRAVVTATTHLRESTGLHDRVQEAVTSRLVELNPAQLRAVTVKIDHEES